MDVDLDPHTATLPTPCSHFPPASGPTHRTGPPACAPTSCRDQMYGYPQYDILRAPWPSPPAVGQLTPHAVPSVHPTSLATPYPPHSSPNFPRTAAPASQRGPEPSLCGWGTSRHPCAAPAPPAFTSSPSPAAFAPATHAPPSFAPAPAPAAGTPYGHAAPPAPHPFAQPLNPASLARSLSGTGITPRPLRAPKPRLGDPGAEPEAEGLLTPHSLNLQAGLRPGYGGSGSGSGDACSGSSDACGSDACSSTNDCGGGGGSGGNGGSGGSGGIGGSAGIGGIRGIGGGDDSPRPRLCEHKHAGACGHGKPGTCGPSGGFTGGEAPAVQALQYKSAPEDRVRYMEYPRSNPGDTTRSNLACGNPLHPPHRRSMHGGAQEGLRGADSGSILCGGRASAGRGGLRHGDGSGGSAFEDSRGDGSNERSRGDEPSDDRRGNIPDRGTVGDTDHGNSMGDTPYDDSRKDIPYGGDSDGETDGECWVCLGGAEGGQLESLCRCPSRRAHKRCWARWCLQQAGRR